MWLFSFRSLRRYLSNLFVPDPTRDWAPGADVPLEFHVFKRALNSIALGDRLDKLVIFGKPSDKNPHRVGTYIWRTMGLAVQTDRDEIWQFTLLFRDRNSKPISWGKFKPATIKLIHLGKSTELSERTREIDVRNFLGQPSKEESFDDFASILIYEFHRLVIMFQFDDQACIEQIDIFDPME